MKVARNVLANYLGRVYSIASIYLFIPFYIKYLGLAAYGVIGFYGIILAIGALVDAGLTATLSREAARRSDPRDVLDLTTIIERILLAASIVFAVAVALGAEFIARRWLNGAGGISESELISSVCLMAFTVPAQLAVSLYIGALLGLQKQGSGNAIQALYVTVRGGLVIPFLAFAPSLELFFGWQLASSAVLMVIARIVLMRSLGLGLFPFGRASFATLKPSLHFAGGMFALTLLAGFNTQIDKALVSKLFTIEQFGVYSLGSVLSQLPYAAAAPLMMAMLPRLTELVASGGEKEASKLYDRFAPIVALIAGFSSFGLILFAPEILKIWLQVSVPPEGSVLIVQLLSFGSLLLALAAAPFNLGLSHGHNRTSVALGCLTMLLSVPMLLAGVHWLGLPGAAVMWIFINGANYIVLTERIHRLYYRGASRPGLVAFSVAGFSATVLALARVTADSLGLSPALACLTAAMFSALAVFTLFQLDRRRAARAT